MAMGNVRKNIMIYKTYYCPFWHMGQKCGYGVREMEVNYNVNYKHRHEASRVLRNEQCLKYKTRILSKF
jgi:hypothetical protein